MTKSNIFIPAIAFDDWVKAQRELGETNNKPPSKIEEKIIERLKNNVYTTGDAILSAVNAWSYYEGTNSITEYPYTLNFIDTCLGLIYKQHKLEIDLYKKKAYLLKLNGAIKETIKTQRKLENLLEVGTNEYDISKIENRVNLAENYSSIGEKKIASSLFLDALSFPWYLIEDNSTRNLQRENYRRAAIGFISCNRENLDALENLFFVPAMKDELQPILDEAINGLKNR